MADEQVKPNAIQQGYDRWSKVYDHDANPLPALEQPIVMEQCGSVAGRRALDLGCGTGRHAIWLARAGAIVTAVDFSDGMLAEARRKSAGLSIDFRALDLHQPLPFADGTFDLIVSGLVLEHLDRLSHFYAEVRRMLSANGRAVISAMHPAMFLRRSHARFTDPETGQIVSPGSHAHSMSDFVMAIVTAGLEIEAITEHSPTAEFATSYPRAEKYVGWPMLVVMRLRPGRGLSV
jgi:malonyl-CoA O-methyltransferase